MSWYPETLHRKLDEAEHNPREWERWFMCQEVLWAHAAAKTGQAPLEFSMLSLRFIRIMKNCLYRLNHGLNPHWAGGLEKDASMALVPGGDDKVFDDMDPNQMAWMLYKLSTFIEQGGGSFRTLVDHLGSDYSTLYCLGGMRFTNALCKARRGM